MRTAFVISEFKLDVFPNFETFSSVSLDINKKIIAQILDRDLNYIYLETLSEWRNMSSYYCGRSNQQVICVHPADFMQAHNAYIH